MINFILNLLDKIPYRTKLGLSLSTVWKYWYFYNIGITKDPKRCLCGGIIKTNCWRVGLEEVGWEISCEDCGLLIDED